MAISSNYEFPVIIETIITLTDGTKITKELTSKIILSGKDYYIKTPEVDSTTGEILTDSSGNIVYTAPVKILNETITQLVKNKLANEYDTLYGDSSAVISDNTTFRYLSTKVKDETSLSSIFRYFYKQFFSLEYEFDVNGYSLIFLYPPDFSGYEKFSTLNTTTSDSTSSTFRYLPPDEAFRTHFADYMLFAVEFEIPDQEVTTSEISLSAHQKIEFVSGFNTSGNLSVRYIDSSKLKMYTFHSNWITYMKMIMRGDIEPDPSYYDSKELDYMGSVYFLKFKPNMDYPNYIGKATGIFPKNLPVKDLLGNRTENQLIMYTINYFYSMYEGSVLNYEEDKYGNILIENNNPKLKQESDIYTEFKNLIASAYDGQ